MTTKKTEDEIPSVDLLLQVAEKMRRDFNQSSGYTTMNEQQLLNLLTYTLQNVKKTQEENKKLQAQLKK